MTPPIDLDPRQTGGGALLLGFVLVFGVLYRDPSHGLDAATAEPAAAVYFLVLPALGLLAGVYASLDAPHGSVPLFVFGSYLGLVGLALAVGGALAATPSGLAVGVGLVVLALAVAALVASVLSVTASLSVGDAGALLGLR